MLITGQYLGQSTTNHLGRTSTVIAQCQHHVEQLPVIARLQRIGTGLRLSQGTPDSGLRGLKIGPCQRCNKF
ncbi:hypothetical protein D3C71_1863420 [compost metagenome]